MTILTIIGIILTAISVWQRCASPAAVLRRIKRGIGREVLHGMVEDGVEMSGQPHLLAEAVMARKDSEIYKFAEEVMNSLPPLDGASDGVKMEAATDSFWDHARSELTIERVRAMMAEAEGLGMKP